MIYGYGNPGRQDDALGILLVDRMEEWCERQGLSFINFDTNYQLNIEDALAISEYDIVIFVDASVEEIPNFEITRVHPCAKIEFTMHATSPEFVLHLCHKLYKKYPDTYLVHVKGYEFEFLGQLTKSADSNLEDCVGYLQKVFTRSGFTNDLFNKPTIEKEDIKI